MALSQKGANYLGRDGIASPPESVKQFAQHVLAAFDDTNSQIQAIRTQGNYGQTGRPSPPHPITAISVRSVGGFAQINLDHHNAPSGTQYIIEYADNSQFRNAQRVDNGISQSWERYLHGKLVFFRAAPKLSASEVGAWIYFGGSANPTSVAF